MIAGKHIKLHYRDDVLQVFHLRTSGREQIVGLIKEVK